MKPLQSVVAAAVLIGLSACTTLSESVLRAYGQSIGINEGVNTILLSAREDGYRLHVGGILSGPPIERSSWSSLQTLATPTGLSIELSVQERGRSEADTLLRRPVEGCPPPITLLQRGLERIEPMIRQWTHGSELPQVALRLVRPGEGLLNHEVSAAPRISGLTMALTERLPDADTCDQHRRWASDALGTIAHEWAHIHVYQRFGPYAPQLGNEIAASAVEQSVALEILGGMPARWVHVAGQADSDDLQQVLQWRKQRGLSTTLAGKFLGDRLRRLSLGDRGLGPQDAAALHAFTARALDELVDPSDPASVARLVAKGSRSGAAATR